MCVHACVSVCVRSFVFKLAFFINLLVSVLSACLVKVGFKSPLSYIFDNFHDFDE